MAKIATLCPHCGTERITIETDNEGRLRKVGGGKSRPVFVIRNDQHLDHAWFEEDKSAGAVVQCKCKALFFVEYHGEKGTCELDKDSLTEGRVSLYCEACQEGAFTKEIVCPKCGNRRVFL